MIKGNIMETVELTPIDIQPKKTKGDSCDQRVRNAWSLQMTEEHKQKFAHFPGFVRQQLYRSFDFEVQDIWVKLMKDHRLQKLSEGVKLVKCLDCWKLPDEHCIDPDETLIVAAKLWLADFAKREAKTV